ncbi:MAG: prolyl-tRNA synthetase associated domain-containing protein [Lachnospiraceae bacterium]|nr:prolyl-tRNA synthetase associated domain-containing protein [Lachnospiraceae bacterium]
MEIYHGRPVDETGRQRREIATYDLLDKLQIPYDRADHEAAMTIDDCKGVDELFGIEICKNLFLCNRQKTTFYLLLMPGKKKFVTKELSRQIESPRLSFADESYMVEFLDIHPGSVSIMGLMNDKDNRVQLLIDRDVTKPEYFGCHPCVNTSSLRLRTADVLGKFLPAVHHTGRIVDL